MSQIEYAISGGAISDNFPVIENFGIPEVKIK